MRKKGLYGWAWTHEVLPKQSPPEGLKYEIIVDASKHTNLSLKELLLRAIEKKAWLRLWWSVPNTDAFHTAALIESDARLIITVSTGVPWICGQLNVPTFQGGKVYGCPYRSGLKGTSIEAPSDALKQATAEAVMCPIGCFHPEAINQEVPPTLGVGKMSDVLIDDVLMRIEECRMVYAALAAQGTPVNAEKVLEDILGIKQVTEEFRSKRARRPRRRKD